MKPTINTYFLLAILISLRFTSALAGAETVVINEFLASNGSSAPIEASELLDEDGDSSDWIEIYNPTDQAVDISGWYLTDNIEDLTKWQFPADVVLESGQMQLVFASGKDRSHPRLHTNFKLSADGEYIGLVQSDGQTVAHAYASQFPQQVSDISYGLADHQIALVHAHTPLFYHAPGPAELESDWMSPDFDDARWQVGYTTIGFSHTPTLQALEMGQARVRGSYVVNGDLHVLSGNGTGLSSTSDAFQFVYTPLKGDNEFSARIVGASLIPSTVKVGIMVRESLEADAAYVAQLLAPGHGTALQWRNSTGGASTYSPGEATITPLWMRIVRQGSKIYGYYSVDGVQWTLQGVKTVAMAENAYIGLFVTAGQEETLCTGLFDQVCLGSTANLRIQDILTDSQTSLWVRAAFELQEKDPTDAVSLHIRHEDGFVAYLNGTEVARDNVSGIPHWDTVADSNRPNAWSHHALEYDATPFASLLRGGTNVLAVQVLNDRADDPALLVSPRLVTKSGRRLPQYFETPTPGQPNTAGALGATITPQFNRDHGFHEVPFLLEITSATNDALIRYTTDCSAPTAVYGHLYTEPIWVSTTTCIRAVATKPGWMPSEVATRSYIFPDQVVQQPSDPPGFPTDWVSDYYEWSYSADYAMDPTIVNHAEYGARIKDDLKSLPTLSLVMDRHDLFDPKSGIYANTNLNHPGGVAWERPGSVELIHPDGSPGFHINCGVRVVGGWGAKPEYRKHSFRLMFKREYGPSKLSYPLFGPDAADEFDTVTLRANFNDCYVAGGSNSQYIRDEFCRRLQLALGQRTGYGTFVHLYVNGLYWGLYNPVERPDAAYAATYFGGDKEDWNAYNSGRTTGESTGESWSGLMSAVGKGLTTYEAYQRIQGKNQNGLPSPHTIPWLDMENYVDYMIMNLFVGNRDWPGHNWYAAFNKVDPSGFKCFSWDAEHVMGLNSDLNTNQTGVSGSIATPYARLRNNEAFKLFFADRVHKAFSLGGACYVDPHYPRWNPRYPERNRPAALYVDLADWIEGGIVCESARWGDVRGGSHDLGDWKQRRDWILQTYLPQRPGIVLTQLRQAGLYPSVDAPRLYINGTLRHGGYVTRGDSLFMLANPGQVYYTLDGTDPHSLVARRATKEGIATSALPFTEPITVNKPIQLKARVLHGSTWSALQEATFAMGAVPDSLRMTELMYHPAEPNAEYVELQNLGSDSLTLQGVEFVRGIQYLFGDLELSPNELVLVVRDLNTFKSVYPQVPESQIAGQYEGSLSDGGERIELQDVLGQIIHSFRYNDTWYDNTDGAGLSLMVTHPLSSDPNHLSEAESWYPSPQMGGSPGIGHD